MAKEKDKKVLVTIRGWFLGFAEKLQDELLKRGVSSEDIYAFVQKKGDPCVSKIAEELVKMLKASTVASELLSPVGTVKVPGNDKFVASDHFTTNSKAVKIAWLGNNFEQHFLAKVEEPQSEVVLRYAKLKQGSSDKPILAELGDKAETTLASIWEFLKKQPNGESGALLTNGYANIFYVRDAKGVLWAVDAYWDSGSWGVYAYSVEDPFRWSDGSRVFSRNS
ncbi:hypothetical protein GW950_00245 [Candidatus Wolfebacteria bacterium]|nr:hypothetical protein [Candidatus Wolfebacteria bacterium]